MRYLLLSLLLLVGCAPMEGQPTTGSGDQAPAIDHVRLIVRNETGRDLSEIELHYADEGRTIDTLAAGARSAPLTLPYAYQSPDAISARDSDGTSLGYSNPNGREMSGEAPITNGEYELILGVYEDDLIVQELRPDSEAVRAVLEPLLTQLGATHEPRIQRGTPFDELAGETVSRQESLVLDASNRIEAYLFADEATAERFAAVIQPGGTTLRDAMREAVTSAVFLEGNAGTPSHWWRDGSILLNFHGGDDSVVQRLSDALGSERLALGRAAGDLLLRLYNKSTIPFDSVGVQSGAGQASFGPLPAGGVSEYQPVDELYRYGAVTIESEARAYKLQPIDYVGETPLPAGQHTFVLQALEDGQLLQMHLRDGQAPRVDEALVGTVWQWVSATRADGSEFTPAGVEGPPTIQFTADRNPNSGEDGLLLNIYLGCNSGGATYLGNEYQQLLVEGISQTAMLCENEAAMESETLLGQALNGILGYNVDGSTLSLYAATMELHFERRGASSNPSGDVLNAMINEWGGQGALVEQNVFFLEGESMEGMRERYEASPMSSGLPLDPALLEAFYAANAAPDVPQPSTDVTRLAPEEAARYFGEGGGGWAAFQENYPDVTALMTCSNPGFAAAQQTALLYCRLRTEAGEQAVVSQFRQHMGRWMSVWSTSLDE